VSIRLIYDLGELFRFRRPFGLAKFRSRPLTLETCYDHKLSSKSFGSVVEQNDAERTAIENIAINFGAVRPPKTNDYVRDISVGCLYVCEPFEIHSSIADNVACRYRVDDRFDIRFVSDLKIKLETFRRNQFYAFPSSLPNKCLLSLHPNSLSRYGAVC